MKFLLSFGVLTFALTFCNLGDRLKQMSGGTTSGSNSSSPGTTTSGSSDTADKVTLSAAQEEIQANAVQTTWDAQGISWKLPASWKKMDVKKETFNYSSPDNAFLLVNISPMSTDFPIDVSLKAYYEQAMQQMKNGKYERARYLEIDGVKGVEFVEAAPEEKDGIRRHQWIAYRDYLGQKQMLNVMTSTRANNFAKHADDFPAIMYSMKVVK